MRLVPLAPIDDRFEKEEDAPEADEKSEGMLMFSLAEIGVGALMVALALGAFTLMHCLRVAAHSSAPTGSSTRPVGAKFGYDFRIIADSIEPEQQIRARTALGSSADAS
jgi:hypothetical protein